MKAFLAILSLAGTIFVWWIKQDADKKALDAERKKEIKDAVYSCDVSRINAVIGKLRS